MKSIPLLLALVFGLSLCGLTDKLSGKKSDQTNSNNSNSSTTTSSSGSSSSSSGSQDKVDRPQPTAAQTAALQGGQQISWDEQGITWTLPPKWSKMTSAKEQFQAGGGGGFLIGTISVLDESFPTDISLNAMYQSAQNDYKNGKYEEVRWLELDGVKGLLTREAMPENQSSPRRLQWQAYRKYAGQTQLVNIILSSSGKDFASKQDAFYGTMYSTKLIH